MLVSTIAWEPFSLKARTATWGGTINFLKTIKFNQNDKYETLRNNLIALGSVSSGDVETNPA